MDHVLRVYDGPLVWGVSDCCACACDVFLALHGVDPMTPLRGAYRSERGAKVAIARRGGWLAMTRALADQAGLTAGQCAAGELILMPAAEGCTLTIGIGHGLAACRVDGGMQAISVDGALASWAYGGGVPCRN